MLNLHAGHGQLTKVVDKVTRYSLTALKTYKRGGFTLQIGRRKALDRSVGGVSKWKHN